MRLSPLSHFRIPSKTCVLFFLSSAIRPSANSPSYPPPRLMPGPKGNSSIPGISPFLFRPFKSAIVVISLTHIFFSQMPYCPDAIQERLRRKTPPFFHSLCLPSVPTPTTDLALLNKHFRPLPFFLRDWDQCPPFCVSEPLSFPIFLACC